MYGLEALSFNIKDGYLGEFNLQTIALCILVANLHRYRIKVSRVQRLLCVDTSRDF